MKIWANCIVNNEENFLWFAVMSIINHVDKVLIYDTGSTDKTIRVIEELQKTHGSKIIFKEVGKVDKYQFTKIRQEMLEKSQCEWIIILDGDEVWWEDSISKLVEVINQKGEQIESIAVPFYNLLGDLYHYQSEDAGRYQILDKKGHLTIRAINKKIKGLHVSNPYGSEGYFDENNYPIQNRDRSNIYYLEKHYLHLSHLKRSSLNQNQNKIKFELGKKFLNDFSLPEVLFNTDKPQFIPDPLIKRAMKYILKSILLTPPRLIKRKVLKSIYG